MEALGWLLSRLAIRPLVQSKHNRLLLLQIIRELTVKAPNSLVPPLNGLSGLLSMVICTTLARALALLVGTPEKHTRKMLPTRTIDGV